MEGYILGDFFTNSSGGLSKNSAKKLAFLTQNKDKVCKILITTLVFEKNAIFFAENCLKKQKIVIITSTSWSQSYDRDLQRQRCKFLQRQLTSLFSL
jgi:hypothetical protein